jgi:hypothetical protein
MAEYIDREAVLNELNKNNITKTITFADGVRIFDRIKHLPAADVVEVVRCKDCIYSRELDKYEKKLYLDNCVGCTQHSVSYHSLIIEDNDFCSYGERKEGEKK